MHQLRLSSADGDHRYTSFQESESAGAWVVYCPKCSQDAHRVKRAGWWDLLCRLFGLYPFKCTKCGYLFHKLQRW